MGFITCNNFWKSDPIECDTWNCSPSCHKTPSRSWRKDSTSWKTELRHGKKHSTICSPVARRYLQGIVMSQALGYPTHRLGLVVPDTKGFWTGASARALHQPSVMVQVFWVIHRYMCSPRTVGKSQSQRYHRNSFQACTSQKRGGLRVEQLPESGRCQGVWGLSQTWVGVTMDVNVNIRTGETYMLFKSYICVTEVKGWTKGTSIQCGKHMGMGVMGRWGGMHTCRVNLIVT